MSALAFGTIRVAIFARSGITPIRSTRGASNVPFSDNVLLGSLSRARTRGALVGKPYVPRYRLCTTSAAPATIAEAADDPSNPGWYSLLRPPPPQLVTGMPLL